jgi:hypothetical protein
MSFAGLAGCSSPVPLRHHILWKRQAVMQLPLAADEKLIRTPVDIVDLDCNDFCRAQPESRQKQHHGIVAPPDCRIRLDGSDHRFHLLRCQVSRQCGRVSLGDARDARSEVRAGLTNLDSWISGVSA